MRTTIDLDPDIDARLRQVARERGLPLKAVINEALRAGAGAAGPGSEPTAYALPTKRLGLRPDVDIDKALSLADQLEDEELVRKLELRK